MQITETGLIARFFIDLRMMAVSGNPVTFAPKAGL